jgi:hypothetical protein
MVDDVISVNSVTSKALTGDFARDSIREVMALVKGSGAVEGSDEHFFLQHNYSSMPVKFF